jgi:hypothetical protein
MQLLRKAKTKTPEVIPMPAGMAIPFISEYVQSYTLITPVIPTIYMSTSIY